MKKWIIQSICLILTSSTFGYNSNASDIKETTFARTSTNSYTRESRSDFKESLGQVEQKRKNIQEKINHHIQGKQHFKQQRLQEKLYHNRNLTHFGKSYELALKIASISSDMMEKHYSGKESVLSGVMCLKELKDSIQEVNRLKQVYQNCLETFNTVKNKKKIYHLNDQTKNEIVEEFNKLFPNQYSLIQFLSKAFIPTVTCTAKGYSLMGAWGIGGSLSGYRLKCSSQLGRRTLYGAMTSSFGIGAGGILGKKIQTYKKNYSNEYTQQTYTICYSRLQNKHMIPSAHTNLSVLLGIESNITPTHWHNNISFGLGYYAGFGFTNVFKVKELTPNFKELFNLLDLGFYS